MADEAITKEYRCGYCYEDFNSMINPKQLPCNHVFCLTCLQGEGKINAQLICPACQQVHEIGDFTELPTVTSDGNKEIANTSTALICDCQNCDGQVAVCYCIQCGYKICDTHKQIHGSLHGERHQVIPIALYDLSPGKYKTAMCCFHNEQVINGCSKCDRFLCSRCETLTGPCKDKETLHKVRSVDELIKKVANYFKKLFKSISGEINRVCKQEKLLWNGLEEKLAECKEKIQRIEQARDEQIAMIISESGKLIKQVEEYQSEYCKYVELYSLELMSKKDQMEQSRIEVHRWLRNSHVTEQVQQRQSMSEELQKYLAYDCSTLRRKGPYRASPSIPILMVEEAQASGMNIKIAYPPTSLTFTSEQSTDAECYSTSYNKDGDLLLACKNGIKLLKTPSMQLINCETDFYQKVYGIQARHREVFVLEDTTDDFYMGDELPEYLCTVYRCSPDIQQRTKLFEFPSMEYVNGRLAVSDKYIVVPQSKQLDIYDFDTRQTTSVALGDDPENVCFLLEGDLLVGSMPRSALFGAVITRYRIENGQLYVVWTSDDFRASEFGFSITVDDSGLIYACGFHFLTIISPADGKVQAEVGHEKIPLIPEQIAVKGNRVAILGDNNEEEVTHRIFQFTLNRDTVSG